MKKEIIARIVAVRAELKKAGVAATMFPQTDPHQSEYLSRHFQVRRYLSGFTGSAGTLVVTSGDALLWTDSRYFIQAADQLEGTGIKLMKEGLPATPGIADWLIGNLVRGSVVAIDGWTSSVTETESLRRKLEENGLSLKVDFDITDTVWPDRPALPGDPIFIHDIKYAGRDAADKIGDILQNASAEGGDAVFISALDEIAWALNIRSRDVSCNPVATAFLYLSAKGSTLFTLESKVDDKVRDYLAERGVTVAPYSSVADFLTNVDGHVVYDAARTSGAAAACLGDRGIACRRSPVAMLKGIKNEVQIAGTREAMIKDGCALVGAFHEIERLVNAGERLTETGVAEILTRYRSQQPLYFDESFETIAGYGAHGAIVHYSATPESDVEIYANNLLLVDSGAQYLDGTTDITRTVSMGNTTDEQRRDFTLVMKGHIALASAVFPDGTRGDQLDALARQFLWKEGLSYLHGTGHGVGHFLNVHEGPQSIRLNHVPTPLTPGMITSDEPGLYRENVHGIRCENLVLTVRAFTTEFGTFNRFETLTLFPFDLKLFDTSIMTADEIEWVNSYHAMVRETLTPRLTPELAEWLAEKTMAL